MGGKTDDQLIQSYLSNGRSVSLNLFYTLPLLLLYELGIQLTGSDFRNAAEVILKDLRFLMGGDLARGFHFFLMAVILIAYWRTLTKKQPIFRYFTLMFAESAALALVLGPLLSIFVGSLLLDFPLTSGDDSSLSTRLLLSIGAGVYEELLFRFLMLGGLYWLLVRGCTLHSTVAAGIAVVVSAILFSIYHHLGPHGPPMALYPVLFRFGAGLVLGLVFIWRGFGVAVYLHVVYDILRDIELMLDGGG